MLILFKDLISPITLLASKEVYESVTTSSELGHYHFRFIYFMMCY